MAEDQLQSYILGVSSLDSGIGDIGMTDMAYLAATEGKAVEINSLFHCITGYDEKYILGREIDEIWKTHLKITIDKDSFKDHREYECFMFDRDNNVKEVSIRYIENYQTQQEIYVFQLIDNSLFDENYPFLEWANSANDTVIALCSVPEYTLLKANTSFFKFFGKHCPTREEMLGLRIEDFIPGFRENEIYEICEKAASTGKAVYYDEKCMEFTGIGRYYARLTLSPVFKGDKVRYLLLIHNDVTEKVMNRKYQHLIEVNRDCLYKLFNSMNLPIVYLSYPELKVIEINQKALSDLIAILGMQNNIVKSQIIGRSICKVIPVIEEWNYAVFLNRLEKTKSTVCHEKMEVFKNGRKFYYNITYQPITDENEDIVELLMVAIDVTDEVEKRNHMEDVLQMKDEFLYFISHEFKTPLTVINAAVQSLEYIYANQIPDKARTLITKIKQNSLRQQRLVNNLLDIARINAGRIKLRKRNIDIVYLARAISESVAIYAQQKDVEIVFTSKFPKRVIGVDDEKLERIMLNLLSNAIKFTPAGKRVFVNVYGKIHNNRRMVCISVKDQGLGIPKEKQSVIFERFGQVDSLMTMQAEGTGIGLFLVKLMVNALDGEIFLESEKDKGSNFTIMIPSKKTNERRRENNIQQISDNRLVQSITIEFSDVY